MTPQENERIVWSLKDFYAGIDDPKVDEEISTIKRKIEELKKQAKGNIAKEDIELEKLLEWLKTYEEIMEQTFYMEVFSYLMYSTNTQDNAVKGFRAKIDEFSADVRRELLFVELEMNKVSDERFNKIISDERFAPFVHALKANRKKKPHQLSEEAEQVIVMKDLTGAEGFNKLYAEIESSFEFEIELEGKKQKLTGPQILSLLQHKDREVRAKALKTFLEAYKENALIFTHIYNNVLKDWNVECQLRKFENPVARRNLENEIDDQIVDVLEEVTTASYSVVERYYNLKKKLLDLPELHMYDIYAPVGTIDKKYSFDEALELVIEADKAFNEEFAQIVKEIAEQKHIDATPRIGKIGGAYCHYGKRHKLPFVFTNFNGTVNSLLTLAHELGHALHFTYIQRHQNFVNFDVALPVAEIASVFNEIVVFDYLLKQDLTKEEKIALICNHLEGNFATSHRQNAFFRFEKRMHELMAKRMPTTEDYLKIFAEEIQKMFGNSIVDVEKDYAPFCFVVSHFLHTPFYVYAYNMSNLLVIALYQLYLEQGKDFVDKYVQMLSLGGSVTPQELLSIVGIDLHDKEFWHRGIKYLEGLISELEALVE